MTNTITQAEIILISIVAAPSEPVRDGNYGLGTTVNSAL
jgi:hypothetical protein